MADKDKFADEIMSDEELDKVVGGNLNETTRDCNFFKALGIYVGSSNLIKDNVSNIFAKYGVSFEQNLRENYYSIGWQKYPHSVALGWVLGAMGYPGYDGNRIFDIAYTGNFIRSHLGDIRANPTGGMPIGQL